MTKWYVYLYVVQMYKSTAAPYFTVYSNILIGFKDKHILEKIASTDVQILKFQGYWSLIEQEYYNSYDKNVLDIIGV